MSHNYTQYLDKYRAEAVSGASPAASEDAVYQLVLQEYIRFHESSVRYEFLSADDTSEDDPVYRLGSAILLQDVQTHLDSLVTKGKIRRINYENAYTCNMSMIR